MDSCELLTIQVVDLEKMRSEFVEIYNSLYASGQQLVIDCLRLKK